MHARLATAAPMRYAFAFALCSSVVMGVLLAVVYWWMSSTLARNLDEGIEAQLQVLRSAYERDGAGSVIDLVHDHDHNYGNSPLHYVVQDRRGRALAGDLPPTDVGAGWHDLSLSLPDASANGPARELRGRGEWLGDDLFVLVTNDTGDLQETRTLIVRSFVIALAATVLLALAGGLLIGRVLVRRVEAVNRTARGIMAGDLSRRIPVVGPRDELGGLAEGINQMLTRIEELMANLQHVSSAIAHDLRTPLGRLRQGLEAVRARPRGAADYEAAIDAAIRETDAVIETFEAMLRIAEIEAGARREGFERVDLAAVVENVIDALTAVAEDRGQRLELRAEGVPAVEGDAQLLTQMLVNLVENAIRHTPPGTAVTVELAGRAQGVRLEVRDTGRGIPSAEREQVLRPFYRLDRGRTTPGSGLGLSLVAAVARLHGARLRLQDGAPGLSVVLEFEPAREPRLSRD